MAWGLIFAAGISAYSSYKADKQAERAQDKADAASQAQLALAKEQYERFTRIYGPIEENLAEFYNNLSSDNLAAIQLTAQRRETQAAKTNISRQLEQRGLAGSGVEAEVMKGVELSSAEQRAEIRANAPLQAAQAKTNFLGIGLGQGQQASNTLSNVYGNQAAQYSNQAAMYQQQAQQGLQSIGGAIGAYAYNQQVTNALRANANVGQQQPPVNNQVMLPVADFRNT